MLLRFFQLSVFCFSLIVSVSNVFAQSGKTSVFIRNRIYSQTLLEEREYCLYLPPNFDPQLIYPVIFASDGQIISEGKYENLLDSLIENKIIPPSVLIGIYSNEQEVSSEEGRTLRYYEYVQRAKQDKILRDRYDRHSDFFLEEIRDSVFSVYRIQPHPQYIIFYGCSNGGDYGMRLLYEHPEKFNYFFCCSPVASVAKRKIFRNLHDRIHLFLSYGKKELESPFGINLVRLDNIIRKNKDPRISVHLYSGGHKREAWEKEFADILPFLFKNQKKE